MAKPARVRIDDEPRFSEPMSKLELVHTLNWYHQNKESKDALNYINLYVKKNKIQGKIDTSNGILTVGWLCRLVLNGNDIGDKGRAYIKKNLFFIDDTPAPVVVVDKGPSIQDRLNEKISEIAGDLEGAIDEVVTSKFNTMPSPFAIMQDRAKGMHANKLVDIFKKRRSEFDDVLNTKDADVREGYSNFTKPQLKKLVAYCDTIITDAMKIAGEAKINRKPRKRKAKTPDQLVSKVQYCEKFDDLKLVSIKPKDIIGALQLWVYNTKSRKLGCYNAEDASGLSVKGSSIISFNESKSTQKKLRKPEVTLPEVLKGGKVYLRTALDDIKAVSATLNGRLNTDTILLRIIK